MKKKLTLSLLSLALFFSCFAQSSEVTSAWNYLRYGELDKAKAAIDKATANAETSVDAKTWFYRGNVYKAIYSSAKYKTLSPDALGEAFQAYKKTVELDKKAKYMDAKDSMLRLAWLYYNETIAAFNKKDWQKALNDFDNFFALLDLMGPENRARMEKSLHDNKIEMDDARYYRAAAAQAAGDKDKATLYFEELVASKSKNARAYTSLTNIYLEKGDTAKALTVIDKGLEALPEEYKKDFLISKLNLYILQGKTKEALELGKQAIEINKNNASVYVAVGSIYDKLNMTTEAQDMYNKAIALKPDDFATNFSVGKSIFNQGVEKYNASVKESDMKKSAAMENEAKDIWKKAIPYLEKAASVETTDKVSKKYVYRTLKEIYAKLGDMNKSNEYKDKMEKM